MHPLLASLASPDPAVVDLVAEVAHQRARRRPPEDTFAWIWSDLVDGAGFAVDRAALQRRMHGGVLVDLGGGRGGLAAPLVRMLGVATWVIVDVAHDPDAPMRVDRDLHRDLAPLSGGPEGCQVLRVQADALDFCSRLPSGSAHVLVGGLDHDVVDHPGWHRALAAAVARVVPDKGIALHTESLVGALLPPLGMRPWTRSPFLAHVAQQDARSGGSWLGTGICEGASRSVERNL